MTRFDTELIIQVKVMGKKEAAKLFIAPPIFE